MTRRRDPDEGREAAPRPPIPIEEMGGDPACWLGLVEDHRDAAAPPDEPDEPDEADGPGDGLSGGGPAPARR